MAKLDRPSAEVNLDYLPLIKSLKILSSGRYTLLFVSTVGVIELLCMMVTVEKRLVYRFVCIARKFFARLIILRGMGGRGGGALLVVAPMPNGRRPDDESRATLSPIDLNPTS